MVFVLSRFKNQELIRIGLTCIAGFAAIRLEYWRALCTLNLTSPFNSLASIALFASEIFAVVGFFLTALQYWDLTPRQEVAFDPLYQPSVDIFITTYNEDVELVRRTVCGAKYIDYPNKRIYILDDGRRDAVLNLAHSLDVNYITRPDNAYAKAGNINNALRQTDGELVVILDADHIPSKYFLKRTVAYFSDAKVAFVQSAHRFMNGAPIQRNLRLEGKLPHEQELFFRLTMVGKDHWNAAIFAGSAGVIRRSVFDELDGMSRGTVIEDCEFSMDVHRRGYKSVYIPESLTVGLSPETLRAYLIQQSRWAKGQTQMLALANPLLVQGLTVQQKLCYLTNNLYYFFGVPRLICLLVPIAFLLLGVCGTAVSWLQYSLMAIPFLFTWLLTQNYIYKNFRHSFWSDVYETVLAPFTCYWTLLTLIDPRAPRFAVTPKGLKTGHFFFDIRVVWGNLVLLVLAVFALFIGVIKLLFQFDPIGTLANVVWDSYNVSVLISAVLVGFERPQVRRAYRVRRSVPVSVECPENFEGLAAGNTVDINEYGARLRILKPNGQIRKDDRINLSLQTEEGTLMEIPARVVRKPPDQEMMTLEVEFLDNDLARIERLIQLVYCAPHTWLSLVEPDDSLLQSFADLIETPLRVITDIRRDLFRYPISIVLPKKLFESQMAKSALLPDKLKALFVEDKTETGAAIGESSEQASNFMEPTEFELSEQMDFD